MSHPYVCNAGEMDKQYQWFVF